MSHNHVIVILSVLLAIATGTAVYLYCTNPVKGFYEVYKTDNLKLFAKDTGNDAERKAGKYFEGGEHVEYKVGTNMIKQFRQHRILNRKDSLEVTRFINFDFDNVFAYMVYLLTTDSPDIPRDNLGFRVYVGEELKPSRSEYGEYFPQTMLFAPTDKGMLRFNKDKEFDFFNQGSICPNNCPNDDGIIVN